MGARRRDLRVLRTVAAQRREITERCGHHGFAHPTLFGSTARGDQGPDSDIDILVWVLGDARGAADRRMALAGELAGLLGRKVDIAIGQWTEPEVVDRALRTGTPLFRRSGPAVRVRRWRYRGDGRRFAGPVGRATAEGWEP